MMDIATLKREEASFRAQARQQTASLIMAAFALVAGLAWNDAISSLIQYLFPVAHNTVVAKIWYAVGITALVVLISMFLVRSKKDNTQ